MSDTLSAAAPPDPRWPIGKYGYLVVRALQRGGRTELDPLRRRIPYQWHGGHYQDHDDQPFLLLHNSAGGFVEGDGAEFRLRAEPDTRTLVTTTEATKFYKSEGGGTSTEIYDFAVGAGATLEYLPDEVIPFARSRVDRRARIALAATSRLVATDLLAAGRIDYRAGEVFEFSALRSELSVSVDGRLRFLDRMVVDEARVGRLARAWDGHPLMGSVVAYAPDLQPQLADAVRERCSGLEGVALGVSVRDGLLAARLLARETWQAHEAVFAVWSAVRPAVVGKPARPIVKC